MPPDDVLEDVTDVLRLVDCREHGSDRVGPDLVAALDELDELLDDGARGHDVLVFAVERQPVSAQGNRGAELLSQRIEDTVLDARELGGHLVRDVQHLLHRLSVGRGSPRPRRRQASFSLTSWLTAEPSARPET